MSDDQSEFSNELKLKLMQLEGVEAVGESIVDGRPCLKVYFRDEASAKAAVLPETGDCSVVKVVSGSIEAQ